MYEKARRGESIEFSPKRISIFQFDMEQSLDMTNSMKEGRWSLLNSMLELFLILVYLINEVEFF